MMCYFNIMVMKYQNMCLVLAQMNNVVQIMKKQTQIVFKAERQISCFKCIAARRVH